MAISDLAPIRPILPDLKSQHSTRATFDYDPRSDILIVSIHGSRPPVTDPVGEHLSLKLDLETDEVVGFQIEGFLLRVVRKHPMFLEVAELAGVPSHEVAAIRRSIAPEVRQRAALDAVLGQLAALSSPREELERERIYWSPPVLTTSRP